MNIQELFQQSNIEFVVEDEHHHARHGWIQTDCPYCSPGTSRYRLGYNLYGKYFSCWSCGPQRSIDTLQLLTSLSFGELKTIYADLPRDEQYRRVFEKKAGKLKLPPGIGKLRKQHKEYLRDRKFDYREIKRIWDIKGIGFRGGRYSWRIFIPVYFDGEVVSWTCRSIVPDHTLRYLSANLDQEKFSSKHLLYGEDFTKGHHSIIVHEGAIDVWRTGPGAVALMGTAYLRQQVKRIARYQKRIICFDSSKEAQERANELCDELSPLEGETINVQMDADDPGSAGPKEVKRLQRMLS